jgi:MYXO-CTERM domain-containing protein
MSESDSAAQDPQQQPPTDPDAIRAEIEQTRAELAETVDALASKLDVKGQAADKAEAAKAKVGAKASQAKAAAPEPVQHVMDTVGAKAGPVAHQVNAKVEPHRGKLIAGVGAGLLVLLVLRRRRHSSADD